MGRGWAGRFRPFHPAYKLEAELIDQVESGATGPLTVNLLTMRRSGHAPVIEWIEGNGCERRRADDSIRNGRERHCE